MYRLNVTSKENNLTGNGYYSLQSLCRHCNYEGITRVKDDTCTTQKCESTLFSSPMEWIEWLNLFTQLQLSLLEKIEDNMAILQYGGVLFPYPTLIWLDDSFIQNEILVEEAQCSEQDMWVCLECWHPQGSRDMFQLKCPERKSDDFSKYHN